MKVHIPKKEISAIEKALVKNKIAQSAKERRDKTLLDFRLGANAVAKLAINTYQEPIKKATTFEELQPIVFDLLDQLQYAVISEQQQEE